MTFNASSFLSKIDHSQSYETEQLTGGLVNITIRATKTNQATNLDRGRFPSHPTIILKHALPYIAAIGPEAPFSRARQRTEALALELFKLPEGSLSGIPLASSVLIPQLLHYDQDECVLVISDLGPLNTLATVLAGLAAAVDPGLTNYRCSNFYRVGSRLGQFLGDLHAPHRVISDRDTSPSDVIAKRDVELEWAVKPIKRHLEKFDILDAKELYNRVVEDFKHADGAEEQSFVLGDLTPGAILLGNMSEVPTPLGVIDWEFSGRGRGMHGDMAQLLAQVHLHLIANARNRAVTSVITAFIDGITTSYRTQRREADTIWASLIPLDHSSSTPPMMGAAVTRMLRSSFILHGREMIDGAFDLDWHCECCDARGEKEKCALINTMVDRGVWYLRKATASDVEFVRQDNWKSVSAEENRVLINMLWRSGHNETT